MNPICSPQLQSGNYGLLAKLLTSLHVAAAYLEAGLVHDLLEAYVLYGEESLGFSFEIQDALLKGRREKQPTFHSNSKRPKVEANDS